MNTLTAEKAHLLPLTTDAQIEDRAFAIFGAADHRQLWLMLLADDGTQLPLMIPVDDLPDRPERADTDLLVAHLAGILAHFGASQLILIWERPGRGLLSPPDADWARALASDCERRGLRLRAQLLSHSRGVSLLSPSDYAPPVAAAPNVEGGARRSRAARVRPTTASNTAGTGY